MWLEFTLGYNRISTRYYFSMNSIYSTSFTRPNWETLNPHISANNHDRDMQFSGMESVFVLVYIQIENSQL